MILASVESSGNYTLKWFRNDVIIEGQKEILLVVHNIKRNDGGRYKCIVSNEVGRRTSDEVAIDVNCEYFFCLILFLIFLIPSNKIEMNCPRHFKKSYTNL